MREMMDRYQVKSLDRHAVKSLARLGAKYATNHIHLLIQVGDTPLGRIMLRIASRYARELQARFRTTGHLFERRYHAVLVDGDAYLLELLRYIHLNPVRAKMVDHVAAYPWSSHHVYLGARVEPCVTAELALSMLHPELSEAIVAYQRFMEALPSGGSPLQDLNPNDRRILGSDKFAAGLLGSAWRPRSRKSLDILIDEACQQFTTTRAALISASRHRQLTQARAWVAHQALILRITSLARVAHAFGRTESGLRQSVKLHFNYP